MGNKFYITTAIPYVNAPPHMGHALEFVQADIISRYHAIKGEDSFLTTGTDENSLKSLQSAEKQGINPQQLCDNNSKLFKDFADAIGLRYSSFMRSSDHEKHWPGADKMWELCNASGDIYKKAYTGLYCVGCEAFYTESELVNGLCPEHMVPPEKVTEENYFFRLSKYEAELKSLIESNKLEIIPEKRKNEVLSFIAAGLEDFSISRSIGRSKGWGIRVPGDDSQTIYVWFDALTVYLTSVGFGINKAKFQKYWPANVHVIGKGVVRFHAVYWPAMLLSAGLDLPSKIFVHGYVTSNGQKMSKSLGNVVDPLTMINKYGRDAVRYYLARNIPTFEDGDFSEQDLVQVINSEMVGNISNFIYRVSTFIYSNFGGNVASHELTPEDKKVVEEVNKHITIFIDNMDKFRINESLSEIAYISSLGNKYFQDSEPWNTIKNNKTRCETTLFISANICKVLGILLQPYVVDVSKRILQIFKLQEALISEAKVTYPGSIAINSPSMPYKRIEDVVNN
ncbi:MAG: methionine--tRNA ligase [Candidatus Micrarchaeaceae archaeon]